MNFENSFIESNGTYFSTVIEGDLKTSRDIADELVTAYGNHKIHANLLSLTPTEYGLVIEAQTLAPNYVATITEWEELFNDVLSDEEEEFDPETYINERVEESLDDIKDSAREVVAVEIDDLTENYPDLDSDIVEYIKNRFEYLFANGVSTLSEFLAMSLTEVDFDESKPDDELPGDSTI